MTIIKEGKRKTSGLKKQPKEQAKRTRYRQSNSIQFAEAQKTVIYDWWVMWKEPTNKKCTIPIPVITALAYIRSYLHQELDFKTGQWINNSAKEMFSWSLEKQ